MRLLYEKPSIESFLFNQQGDEGLVPEKKIDEVELYLHAKRDHVLTEVVWRRWSWGLL